MSAAGIPLIPTAAAAIAGFMAGAVWYGALAKPWAKAAGMTDDDVNKTPTAAMVLALAFNIIAAILLGQLLAALYPDGATIANSVRLGLMLALGFIGPALAVNYAFQSRPPALTVIDGGHWALVLGIQSAILGWFMS